MLYLASKVSSASFSWRQRLSVPRPVHDDDKRGNAIEIPTRARGGVEHPNPRVMRLWTPPMPPVPSPKIAVSRDARGGVGGMRVEAQPMVYGKQSSSLGQARESVVLKEQLVGRALLEGKRRATGAWGFFSSSLLLFFVRFFLEFFFFSA